VNCIKVLLLFLAMTAWGCKFPPKPPMPIPCSSTPAVESVTNVLSRSSLINKLNGFALQNRVPTYQDDILPLLSSNTTGRNYSCATCHSYMRTSSLVIPKLSMIIAAIKPGAPSPMPKVGYDRVSSQDIALLESWQAAKFPLTAADLVNNTNNSNGSPNVAGDKKQSGNLGVNDANQSGSNQGRRADQAAEASTRAGCN
jgi:hypothetical protein